MGLLIVAVLAAGGMAQAQPSGAAHYQPAYGGVYRGAILLSSSSDRDAIITALTKVGLVQLDANGKIQPALATSWDISDDHQTVTLHLSDKLSAQAALQTLKAQSQPGYWDDARATATDANTLQLHVAEPWAGFITELVTPIFNSGPYRLDTKHTKTDLLVLTANKQALRRPYLSKLELHLYTDLPTLEHAVRKGAVDGAYLGDMALDGSAPTGWQTSVSGSRLQHLVFVNTRKDTLKDAAVRKRLLNFEQFSSPLQLQMAVSDSPMMQTLASDLVSRWAQKNVTVTIQSYPALSLAKSVLPGRNYDLLLLGVDYGPDGDLYPYWHSSQIASPGLNLAGFRNKDVDKLLEQARNEPDMDKRHSLFAQAQKILDDNAVVLALPGPKITFIRSPKIKGDIPQNLASPDNRWTTLSGWYMKQRRVA